VADAKIGSDESGSAEIAVQKSFSLFRNAWHICPAEFNKDKFKRVKK